MTGIKIINALSLLVLIPVFSFCQTPREVKSLIDSASSYLCKGDTLRAIYFYERIAAEHPQDGVIGTTNRYLANFYLARNKIDLALQKLCYALHYTAINYPSFWEDSNCNSIKYVNFSSAKADLCVSLSQVYLRKHDLNNCYKYLLLADSYYLPYKTCGNGIIMYKSYLSPFSAEYYLARRDTMRAIYRLLDYCMELDGNAALITQKLKAILLSKYSQQQIAKEIANGIQRIAIEKSKDETNSILLITLFGHTLRKWGWDQSVSMQKQQLAQNKYLRYLTDPNQ